MVHRREKEAPARSIAWWRRFALPIQSHFAAKEMEEIVHSAFGFVATRRGIVTVVGNHGGFPVTESLLGSAFLQTLYGNTASSKEVISGQLFYEGSLLTPAEILLLVSYVNDRSLLCSSVRVEEAVEQSIELNMPLWMWEVGVGVMARNDDERNARKTDILQALNLETKREALIGSLSHQEQIMLQ